MPKNSQPDTQNARKKKGCDQTAITAETPNQNKNAKKHPIKNSEGQN